MLLVTDKSRYDIYNATLLVKVTVKMTENRDIVGTHKQEG